MSASQPALFNVQEFTDNGVTLVGGRVYTYAFGTTTFKAAYTDPAGTIPHTYTADGLGGQYIALNIRGELPAPLYLGTGSYDISLKRADATTVWTRKADGVDNLVNGFVAALIATMGASLIGWIQSGIGAIYRTILDKLRDVTNVRDYGADPTGITNSLSAFNSAIATVALAGGGEVVAKGIYKISGGAILLPSNVVLNLWGATLVGDGALLPGDAPTDKILIKAAAMLAGGLTDITPEYGTGTTGSGTNYVSNASVRGGKFTNANCGILAQRFNWGCTIEHNWFDATLTNSYISEQSWGLKVHQNTIFAPAIMRDFVDWTEVTGNSFEGPGSTTSSSSALTITSGGYGGSYSAKIESNGFHHWATGIALTAETTNLSIKDNHFEDVRFHVSGNALLQDKLDISQNWMKANLPVAGTVIPIVLLNAKNSKIGPNYFSRSGPSTFDAYVVMDTVNCFGNQVSVDYQPTGIADLTMYRLNEGNLTVQYGGSNNPFLAQPSEERMSGVGAFTFEVYKRRYNLVSNRIPFCTVNYVGSVVTIDTWIPVDAYGLTSRVAFNFVINGISTFVVAGDLIGFTFITKVSFDRFTPAIAGPTIVASANSGVLRFTISGASTGGNITGWVKQL